jgi:Bifunctional DNA primase/polymerase, N-terminal
MRPPDNVRSRPHDKGGSHTAHTGLPTGTPDANSGRRQGPSHGPRRWAMNGPMTTTEAVELAQRWGDIDTPAGPIALKWDSEAGRIAKRPLTSHGHHDFTTDPDEIGRRFAGITLRAGEELGVGIWPGPRGWWVLDLDITDNADGRDTLHDLEQAGGELPVHPIGTTPSGGEHRFLSQTRVPQFVVTRGRGSSR